MLKKTSLENVQKFGNTRSRKLIDLREDQPNFIQQDLRIYDVAMSGINNKIKTIEIICGDTAQSPRLFNTSSERDIKIVGYTLYFHGEPLKSELF